MARARIRRLKFLGKTLLVALAYFLAAKAGLALAVVQPNATAIWIPTGIAIAALIALGDRFWLAVFLGAFFANVTTGHTGPFVATGIALGNTIEAIIASYFVKRFAGGVKALDGAEGIFEYSFWAGLVATAVGATLGTLCLAFAHQLAWGDYGAAWTTWWLGDLGGALIAGPMLILWLQRKPLVWTRKNFLNGVALVAIFAVCSYFVLRNDAIFIYLMFPVLVWVAFSFGNRVVATGIFVLTEASVWGTLRGLGPFILQSRGSVNNALLLTDSAMSAIMVTMLIFSSIVEEQWKARLVLEHQRTMEEGALSIVNDALIVVDRHGRTMVANSKAEALLGMRREDLLGRDFFETVTMEREDGSVVLREDRPLMRALEGGTRITNNPGVGGEYYVHKDGHRTLVSYTAEPVIRDGEVVGAVEFFVDFTSVRKEERERTDLLALASHQLRTPLSIIGLSSELLQGQGKLFGDADKYEIDSYAKDIQVATRQMMDIVNDLLSVSRIESETLTPRPATVNVGQLARKVLDDIAPRIKAKRLKVNFRITKEATEFATDPSLLTIILQNLVSNAVKYAMEGTPVGISITKEKEDEAIVVTDTGRGIPQDEQEKIFTKFFRASNVLRGGGEGTGLGLYITKALVEELGGTISFVSAEGQGTTFFVRLPPFDKESPYAVA